MGRSSPSTIPQNVSSLTPSKVQRVRPERLSWSARKIASRPCPSALTAVKDVRTSGDTSVVCVDRPHGGDRTRESLGLGAAQRAKLGHGGQLLRDKVGRAEEGFNSTLTGVS